MEASRWRPAPRDDHPLPVTGDSDPKTVAYDNMMTDFMHKYQPPGTALAETDRLDPGWRLEELEARRVKIPDKENSALHILAVKKLMPGNWGGDPQFNELFAQEVSEAQLNEAQVKALRAELGRAAAALAECGLAERAFPPEVARREHADHVHAV